MIGINKQCSIILVIAALLTINATTPNNTITNEAEGSTIDKEDIIYKLKSPTEIKPAPETVSKLKEMCKGSDGEWISGECTFTTKKGDDQWNTGEQDQVAFEHDLADDGLLDAYEEQQEESEKEQEKEEVQQVIDDINNKEEEEEEESGGKDEDNDGKEDSNNLEWENNDYKDDEDDDD